MVRLRRVAIECPDGRRAKIVVRPEGGGAVLLELMERWGWILMASEIISEEECCYWAVCLRGVEEPCPLT
jgi:hypothetical protein